MHRRTLLAGIATLALGPALCDRRLIRLARAQQAQPRYNVLVFSRTTGFRHDSIPDAINAVRALGDQHGFLVDATEDPSVFTDATLARNTVRSSS